LPTHKLKTYASILGSDCPFFLEASPMLATGRGEILNPIKINLSGLTLVIVKPSISVSTAEAYSGVTPFQNGDRLEDILGEPIHNWNQKLKNDFEESVFKKYPEINIFKNKLYELGAIYASMSGSGSAVFGLFENQIQIKNQFEGSTAWQTIL
jgi:4-diphosphocytidyl-2-C-methyl-D-erythritol kinase